MAVRNVSCFNDINNDISTVPYILVILKRNI